jgi:hypothetical protein
VQRGKMKIQNYNKNINWHGSFYELSIQLSSNPDKLKILSTLKLLFNGIDIKGPYRNTNQFVETIEISENIISEVFTLYGLVKIENKQLGISISTIREENNDWISISFATGMLTTAFKIKYPLYSETNSWIKIIDTFFLALCDKLYKNIKFEIAIIGEEVSGYIAESELTNKEMENGGILIQENTYRRLHGKVEYSKLPSGLFYIKPNGMLNITYGKIK